MEFTKENWENAPEGARLECKLNGGWEPVELIGYTRRGRKIIETHADEVVLDATHFSLRIILPKRTVTVQLWRMRDGREVSRVGIGFYANWTLLGEHTFEIEVE